VALNRVPAFMAGPCSYSGWGCFVHRRLAQHIFGMGSVAVCNFVSQTSCLFSRITVGVADQRMAVLLSYASVP
jgi:hypothetical protein